ncbi:fasciclin-2 [Chironomus tepperi]|uniref:fasciclin-2 n=1 Tax=Chironomus tepperi TaxID=113505 RepID=UPI00391F1BE7
MNLNQFIFLFTTINLFSIFECQMSKEPRLEILPNQSVQRRPVNKPLVLTCSPNVEQKELITDLKWKDSYNNTINPKQYGSQPPIIYTESLNVNQLMLVITSLSESLAGYFYCSASYANSEYLEEKVKIETFVGITFRDAPDYQNPTLNTDYVVKCIVTASPPASIDWMRNGDAIKSSEKFIIKHDGLLIKNVQESDDGIYTCRAAVIQTGELAERAIRLDVQIKPTVEPLEYRYEAVEGEEFSVKCVATGKPPPLIQWIKDQKDMSLADRFSVVPHNGQMSISRVDEFDRGVYKCIAKNNAGIAEEETRIDVVVKPKIFQLINITVPLHGESTLVCKSRGWPVPTVTFRRYGSMDEFRQGSQDDDGRITLEQTIDNEIWEGTGTLYITDTLRSDDGLYQCVARNKGGETFGLPHGHIAVEYPPNFDHMKDLPPVFSWEEREANLSCMAMAFPNATIEWRWNERLVREMHDKFLRIVEDGPRSDLMVTPADRRYYSNYKCIAVNKLGREEHIMELREGRLPPPVAQAKPIDVTATTITFEIIGPAYEPGLPIKSYTAQYKEERSLDWTYALNRTWTPDTPYVVENLRPQTMYTFRFSARNDVGLGQWSAIRVQGTPSRSVPQSPKILNQFTHQEEGEIPIATSIYADKFEMTWSRPPDNGEPIDFYSIKYCPGSKINNVWNEIGNMCNEINYIAYTFSNQVLKDLTPDSYYQIELRAHNAIGFSLPTHIYMRTAKGELKREQAVEERIAISSFTIITISIVGIILLVILIDLLCCVTNNVGIIALIFQRKSHVGATRLERDERRVLTNGRTEKRELINLNQRHNDEIIGKHSAV